MTFNIKKERSKNQNLGQNRKYSNNLTSSIYNNDPWGYLPTSGSLHGNSRPSSVHYDSEVNERFMPPSSKIASKYQISISRSTSKIGNNENEHNTNNLNNDQNNYDFNENNPQNAYKFDRNDNTSSFLRNQRNSRNPIRNISPNNGPINEDNRDNTREGSVTRHRKQGRFNEFDDELNDSNHATYPERIGSKNMRNLDRKRQIPIRPPKSSKNSDFCYKFITNLAKILFMLLLLGTLSINIYTSIFRSDGPKPLNDHIIMVQEKFNLNFPKNNSPEKSIKIVVKSSKNKVYVEVNGAFIYVDQHQNTGRGLHVLVLSSITADIVAKYIFDTYTPTMEDSLLTFLTSLNPDRILIMMIKDEASTNLKDNTRKIIANKFKSKHIGAVDFRSMWALIATTGNSTTNSSPEIIGEQISLSANKKDWANEVKLEKVLQLIENKVWCPNWGEDNGDDRFIDLRRKFCQKYGGYNTLCKCERPDSLRFYPEELKENLVYETDVVIMTCDRPRSLYRSIRSVLNAYGVNREKIWIMVDGYDYADETKFLAKLFGVNWKVFAPRGVQKARITQHYGSVLKWVFSPERTAEQVIILEDDLEVSNDFFSYFSQTIGILKEDASLWCISAWNDYSFKHTSGSESKTYRVEGMPGLGWMLTKSLYKGELEELWPEISEKRAWDEWLRQDQNLGRKECIIPDIPRTYHFSSKNKALPAHYQDDYFSKKSFMENTLDYPATLVNLDLLIADKYEDLMYKLVSSSMLVDHMVSPCNSDFMKNADPKNSYVAYFRMAYDKSTEVFLNIAKCLKIWDIDTRSMHKGSVRMYINKAPIIFVGYPASPYSVHKPNSVVAYYF